LARGVLAALVILLIVLGGYLAYLTYAVEHVVVGDIGVKGFNVELTAEGLTISPIVRINVTNPTGIDVWVAEVKCIICIQNACSSSTRPGFTVPAHESIVLEIPVSLSLSKTAKALYEAVESGGPLNLTVRVELLAPVRLLGIELWRVKLVAVKTVTVTAGGPAGEASSPRNLVVEGVEWLVDGRPALAVRPGDNVTAVVKLYSPSGYTGPVRLVVLADIPLLPDLVVVNATYTVSIPPDGYAVIKASFRARAGNLRGYYIAVYQGPCPVYVMPDKYPPRLRLIHS